MATSDTNANEHGKRRMNSRQATIERHAGMELVHRRVKIDPATTASRNSETYEKQANSSITCTTSYSNVGTPA